MFDNYKDLLDITDIQNALGIGRTMAYRLINDGKIRHMRVGKAIRVPKSYLMDFVDNSCYTDTVVASLPSKGGKS